MTLPRFLDRIADAAGPLLGGMTRSELGARLASTAVRLEMASDVAVLPGQREAFLFATNLIARLYPDLILDGPSELVKEAGALAARINPLVGQADAVPDLSLRIGRGTPSARDVVVCSQGWNVLVDCGEEQASTAAPPAAMAAAALGVGELFRACFVDELGDRGRTAPVGWSFNLITFEDADDRVPFLDSLDVGTIHLAGAGAIGQAAAKTIRSLPVSGTLVAVDPEKIDLGNLQRYVLTDDSDIGRGKPGLIGRAFEGHSLQIRKIGGAWGAHPAAGPGAETVLTALDTEQGRIEVAAGLPRYAYNAWTQAEDCGVSWHEDFGEEPCLACLYWPTGERPSRIDLIARGLREHPLRVSAYLLQKWPVGTPLPPASVAPTRAVPLPPDHASWSARALLDDVAERFGVDRAELAAFDGAQIGRLYQQGVCAGILLTEQNSERPREVAAPLAHQSALAGILLATALVSARSEALREFRPQSSNQARYDVIRGGRQRLLRPRNRHPHCLCSDTAFVDRYRELWGAEP